MQTLEHEFLDKLKLLIGTPSVSSFHASLDMGNLDIIHLLANWYEEAGFVSQILPLDGFDNKANLLATLGTGDGGLYLQVIPIQSLMMILVGTLTRLRYTLKTINCLV
jgi:acetylornithine deacetylase/succinyl-diaminopimelate desuccinylase-like protein